MIGISKIIGIRPEWLAEGTGPMRPATAPQKPEIDAEEAGYLPVRRVRFKADAGITGYTVELDESDSPPIFFRADWYKAKGVRPADLVAIRVNGDSMQPSLFDSDLVVVNTADNTPRDGEVFAVNYEGTPVIKRLRRDGGQWWLDSDNPDSARYKPRQCGDGCHIIGRVIYKQSERI